MEMLPVPVAVGGVRFTRYDYDEHADVLHLDKAIQGKVADEDTREGHVVFVGPSGRVIALTIMDARAAVERDGTLKITLRAGGPTTRLERETVEPLLVETIRY